MQVQRIFLVFILLSMTYLTIINALSEENNNDLRVKRSLIKKRFYDFGSRSIPSTAAADDDDFQILNDEYDRFRRFYDFGTRKRFYDFGSKKRSDD